MRGFLLFLILFVILALAQVCHAKDSVGSFCSWDHPGMHKYEPYPTKALDDYYMDFQVRAALKAKMEAHQYDDVVTITRDGIKGYKNLREMHYGRGMVCPGRVDTHGWSQNHVERALVYCSGTTCVAVPTVCNNVSLVDREEESPIDISPSARSPSGASQPGVDAGSGQPGRVLADDSNPGLLAGMGEGDTGESGQTTSSGFEGTPNGSNGGYTGGDGGFVFPPIGGGGSGGCGCVPPPPICSVPEPSEWIMLLAGVACLWYRWRTRDKRRD